ncbi:hypothetical protein Cgig2_011689 [Carnegiea gigantea]|uniref:Sec-independent protein translocase protein TATA, chloroplastic n=1 Tax=Carnegiea gigantea TaxID=171969 RepID=A0A9Q1Q945_9CARY|nr:hypothetical protein Cgig2_011689 [Carnegiea gigantea]
MEISSLSPTLSLSSSFPKPAISSSKSSLFVSHSSAAFFRSVNNSRLAVARTRPGNPARRGFSCNALFGLGVPELAVIAGVAALVFGPKKLPEIGRSIGKTVKSFQQAAKEFESELKKPEEPEAADKTIEAKSASTGSEEKENISVSSSKERS